MNQKNMKQNNITLPTLITAGSTYMDIDAYACCVALAELLQLKGENAFAYSCAPCNYSVCKSLITEGQIMDSLPSHFNMERAEYIIVDVSDPDYIQDSAPLNQVVKVYDHHVGFEQYWQERIGEDSHIEFIGAAATLIYREWEKAGLQDKMSRSTALLLIAAILDNTLNLISSNTTPEDIEVFQKLCEKEKIDEEWCASYFAEVQLNVEADLKNALFKDLKNIGKNDVLPSKVAQICVWDAYGILEKLSEIRQWFHSGDNWMLNIIDIKERCSYFVCDTLCHQKEIEKIFDVHFEDGVARTATPYLRKQILKNVLDSI